jgi:hypothetical protein
MVERWRFAMNAARQGIPLRPDRDALAQADRRSVVRVCAAYVLGRRDGVLPEQIIAKHWGSDVVAKTIIKAPASPTGTGSGYPAIQATKLLPALAPQAAATRLLGLGAKYSLAGVSTLSLPYIGKSGRPASVPFVAEGAPFPVVWLNTKAVTLGPTSKMLIGAALTKEVQQASAETAEKIVGDALAASVTESLDAWLFSANAAIPGVTPPGLLFGLTAIPSTGGSGAEGIADDLGQLAAAIGNAGIHTDDMVIVTTPKMAMKLSVLVSATFDNTVLASAALPGGTAIGIAPRGLATGYDGGATIDISDQAELHMEDAAPAEIVASPSTVAAPARSLFQTDALALRARCWTAYTVHPGAVAYLTGAAW